VVDSFNKIDHDFASQVTDIRVEVPAEVPFPEGTVKVSPALSQAVFPKKTISTRRIAFLAASGFSGAEYETISGSLKMAGASPFLVSTVLGQVPGKREDNYEAKFSFATSKSVMFDAVVVLGGKESVNRLGRLGIALGFILEAFKHGKAIAALEEGVEILESLSLPGIKVSDGEEVVSDKGVVTVRKYVPSEKEDEQNFFKELFAAIAAHRHYERDVTGIMVE